MKCLTNSYKFYSLFKKCINTDREERGTPKVSCILPTKNRSEFLLQALKYFQKQDYPNTELIIIYESENDLPEGLEQSKKIAFLKVEQNLSIGAKRNLACKAASGEIIVQWDDDDWYSENRISVQVKPILDGECDITAFNNTMFFDLKNKNLWKCSVELFEKICLKGVLGGTLAFRKNMMDTVEYPDTSLREDADLLDKMLKNSFRLKKIDGQNHFIYIRHDFNTWRFKVGEFFDYREWQQVELPDFLSADYDFYDHMSRSLQKENDMCYEPKVTCIMPTCNRREFVKRAIVFFQNQTYQNKELIIIDDGENKVDDLIPENTATIRYIGLINRKILGAKRNMACEKADGQIILHWDDDDYYSNEWIALQVAHLLRNNADVTGLSSFYCLQEEYKKAWHYIYPKQNKKWVYGATLCYTKSFWKRNPFPEINVGEDVHFLWNNCPKKIVAHNHISDYVGSIHEGNTSPKMLTDNRWSPIDLSIVQNNTKVHFNE
ncbi:glycosyltransferase [Prolixibacteraceae bacterium JC049]|nr:glycosyltransferase [Prolixibacteraceae bacterium JC049]